LLKSCLKGRIELGAATEPTLCRRCPRNCKEVDSMNRCRLVRLSLFKDTDPGLIFRSSADRSEPKGWSVHVTMRPAPSATAEYGGIEEMRVTVWRRWILYRRANETPRWCNKKPRSDGVCVELHIAIGHLAKHRHATRTDRSCRSPLPLLDRFTEPVHRSLWKGMKTSALKFARSKRPIVA
jgi:hypothetical protein